MHCLLLVLSLLFVLAAAAVADPEAATETAIPSPPTEATPPPASEAAKKPQSPPTTASKPEAKKTPAEIRKISDEHVRQCMRDWDAATHMTKKEWERTCRRLAHDRVNWWQGSQSR